MMVKHFDFWNEDGKKGRVGVLLDNDYFEIFQVCGVALPAEGLLPLLKTALTKENLERADTLNCSRKHKVNVEKFQGMSGAINYILRSLTDRDRGIVKRCACLHISMNNKLNKGLSCWLGDLPELVNAAALPSSDWFELEEAEIRAEGLNWHTPVSSLVDILEEEHDREDS